MRNVRFSRSARSQVRSILEASFEGWGAEGRDRYEALLLAAIEAIALDPHAPTTRGRGHLGAGVRCFHLRHARRDSGVRSPVHVVYYRIATDAVEVIAILHEHMDPTRHLPARRALARRPRHP